MEFRIEVNGRETTVCFSSELLIYPKRRQIEVEYSYQLTMRFLRYAEGIILRSDLFNLATECDYDIIIERVADLQSEYEETANYQNGKKWLHDERAEFSLTNVRVVVDNNKMRVTIQVPSSAVVSINSKEVLEFENKFLMELEQ